MGKGDAGERLIYVLNPHHRKTMSVIEPGTWTTLSEIKVSEKPTALQVNTLENRAFIVDNVNKSVAVLNTKNNTFVKEIPLGHESNLLVLSLNGQRLFSAAEDKPLISVIDTTSGKVIGGIQLSAPPALMAISASGSQLFTVARNSNEVIAVNLRNPKERTAYRLGKGVTAIATDKSGTRLLVAYAAEKRVTLMNTLNGQILKTATPEATRDSISVAGNDQDIYVYSKSQQQASILGMGTLNLKQVDVLPDTYSENVLQRHLPTQGTETSAAPQKVSMNRMDLYRQPHGHFYNNKINETILQYLNNTETTSAIPFALPP